MQSEPSTVSQNDSTDSNHEAYDSAHHGRHEHDATVDLSPDDSGAEQTTTTSAEQIAADADFATSLQEGRDVLARADLRSSPQSTPSPPSGFNRITQYEKASTPPVRKKEGPGFEVIKKHRSPSDKTSVIQELPNGMVGMCGISGNHG